MKAGELHVTQRASRYCEIGSPKSETSRRDYSHRSRYPHAAAQKAWKIGMSGGPAGLVLVLNRNGRDSPPRGSLAQPRPDNDRGGGGGKEGKPEICPACLPAFLGLLVCQP